jgi:hypothetical protein
MLHRFAWALLFVLLPLRNVIAEAAAPIVVTHDNGGHLGERAAEIRRLHAAGTKIVIDGRCASACTFYLSLNPCVTERAVFGFHLPKPANAEPVMRDYYPASINNWIDAKGGLTDRVLWLSGEELRTLIPLCPTRG